MNGWMDEENKQIKNEIEKKILKKFNVRGDDNWQLMGEWNGIKLFESNAYRHLAPTAVKASNTIVRFHGLSALAALSGAIAFGPMV